MLHLPAFFGRHDSEIETPDSGSMGIDKDRLKERIIAALREIYDPELPVNIYDLGLIYSIDIEALNDSGAKVDINMTLTAPACPVAGTLPGMVEAALKQLDEVRDASVKLVWDPPWSVDQMSEDARMILGMYD
jgi:FeS assembly SUF system protein